MHIFKKSILFSILFLMSSCSISNFNEVKNSNKYSVELETPIDEYNVHFKEHLKRLFYNENKKIIKKYVLRTNITFLSTQTLSVSGANVLKSTKAQVDYELKNKDTNKTIRSGSINTYPALSSSSESLYSQEKSIEHIKERLIKSSAKSLYMYIKIILRRLS